MVRAGWDIDFIKNEMPLSLFKDAVLIVHRHNLLQKSMITQALVETVGMVLSKDGGKALSQSIEKGFDDISKKLEAGLPDDRAMQASQTKPEGDEKEELQDKQLKTLKTLAQFHAQFGKFTGIKMPSLDSVISKSKAEQYQMPDMTPEKLVETAVQNLQRKKKTVEADTSLDQKSGLTDKQQKTLELLTKFHKSFGKMTGIVMPGLGRIIERAKGEQKQMLDMRED